MENWFWGFGIILNLILMYSNGSVIKYEDSMPQYKIEEPTIDLKQDIAVEPSNLDNESIDRILKHQSVILDRLMNMTVSHEESLRRLIKDSKDEFTLSKPENTRRSIPKPQFSPKRVALRMGKVLPSYANLVKDIFMNNVGDIAEPHSTEYEELDRTGEDEGAENEEATLPDTRRSGTNTKEKSNNITNWCMNAFRCTRTYIPICGHDDAFGFAKFDDICHMLNSNCYWKFNFVLVPACKP